MRAWVALSGLTACLLLAGCASLGGPSPEARYQQAQQSCSAYGFHTGTDAFASCMMQMDQMQQEQNQQRRAAIIASLQNMKNSNRSVTCDYNSTVYPGGGRYSGGTVYGSTTTTCR